VLWLDQKEQTKKRNPERGSLNPDKGKCPNPEEERSLVGGGGFIVGETARPKLHRGAGKGLVIKGENKGGGKKIA